MAVHDVLDAAGGERRHTPLRRLDVRQQALQIALEEALAEPVGYSVREARRGARLIRSQYPAHAFFAQIVGLIRFAQHRELAAAALAIRFEFRRFVVHDVLVFDGYGRHVEPNMRPVCRA